MDVRGKNYFVMSGSCLDRLTELADESVDAVVTDPPYELGFMGKKWDNSGIAFDIAVWAECLRVLKPGGYILAFGGTRTWHRIAVAIEDAGFEIRDSFAWLYGSGFPKSHNLKYEWAGWGTALKPAFEPIIMGRKPLTEKTVAANVLKYGTGAINIDATRIAANGENLNGGKKGGTDNEVYSKGLGDSSGISQALDGRWPANVLLDEYTAELVDEQSGFSKSTGVINRFTNGAKPFGGAVGEAYESVQGIADSGGASRFFYISKANKKDRNEGDVANTHPTVKPTNLMEYLIKLVTQPGGTVLDPFTGSGSTGKAALLNGYKFIGVELTEEYLPIIQGRLEHAEEKANINKGLF